MKPELQDRAQTRAHAPPPRPGAATLPAALRWALIATTVAAIGIYVVLAARRVGYPFQLEWLEGGPAEEVRRLLGGHALYTAPSVDYVPYPYPPLYFWLSALLARITGQGFLALRLVSAAASLASMGLLYALVAREGSRLGGLVAAGVFAAAFRVTGGFYDVARVDSLFVALFLACLAATAAATRSGRRSAFALAGMLLCLSALTKQTALIAGVPIGAWLLLRRDGHRAHALAFAGGTLVPLGAVSLWLTISSRGWFGVAVAGVLAGHPVAGQWWLGFWSRDLAPILIPTAVLVGVLVTLRRRRPEGTWGLYAAAAGGLVLSAYVSQLHSGGSENALIPALGAAALLCGLALAAAHRQAARIQVQVGVVCLAQLALLAYNPAAQVPLSAQAAQARRLMAVVRRIPGEVLVVSHPWEVTLAGKGDHAQAAAIADWARTRDARARVTLERSIADAVENQRFSVLAFDGPQDYSGFPPGLDRWYRSVAAPAGLDGPAPSSLATPRIGHPTQWWVARRLTINPLTAALPAAGG